MSIKNQHYFVIFISVLIFSCQQNRQVCKSQQISKCFLSGIDILQFAEKDNLSISDFANRFIQQETQLFTTSSHKTTVITSKKGLKITVNPSALEKLDGSSVDGKIDVSIIELTNTADFFRSNAATVSNGNLLASGGSYFIGMECNGKALRIKNGQSIQMQFPQLKDAAMELFYGQRNQDGAMNWVPAGIPLKENEEEDLTFTETNDDYPADRLPDFAFNEKHELRIYKSLKEEVHYYDKKMTIRELVDTINRYRPKILIDTIYNWPKEIANLPKGQRVDTNYLYNLYGPPYLFFIKTYKAKQDELARAAAAALAKEEAIKNWQPKQLLGQLHKYYAPNLVQSLGWINCDRFYKSKEQCELLMDLPITFNQGTIQYFLIFKSINGVTSGHLKASSNQSISLGKFPVGEMASLIVFAKTNGQLFQFKQEILMQKAKPIMANLTTISELELKKIFGNNVKT